MIRTIEEVLALYQPEPLALPRCPVHAELIKPTRSFQFHSDTFGVSAGADYVSEEYRELPRGKKKPPGFAFVLYTDDLHPLDQMAPGPKMLGPLGMLTSNPFTWHTLRLTAAAFLSGRAVLRLHLQQLSAGNAVHHPRYNPQLIEQLLAHYAAHRPAPAPTPVPVTEPVYYQKQNQLFT